jgi:hypothetical protein
MKDSKVTLKIVPKDFQLIQSSQSSVEIRRGPKTIDIQVKAYADDVTVAANLASKTYKKLAKEFPDSSA